MKQAIGIALGVLFFTAELSATAGTFYISSSTGSDTNTAAQAQSNSSPWAHLPCMANASGNAVSYVPTPGDIFILKGGDTWTNASFPCAWKWSGTKTSPITIRTDQTWYKGSSWSRPIWDGGGIQISGPKKTFFHVNFLPVQYVTLSSIEMKGFYWAAKPSYGTCAIILGAGGQNLILDNLYIHGWSHDSYASGGADECPAILGDTNSPYMSGSVLQNSVIDGSDSTGGGDSGGTYAWPSFVNNVMRNVPNFILPLGNATISGNLLYNCTDSFDPYNHGNFIETLGGPSGGFTVYIGNNVIHDGSKRCESAFLGNPGETDYVWNNVWYNLNENGPELTQNVSPGVAVYFWNNTIVPPAGQYCLRDGHSGSYSVIEFINNHCITTASQVLSPTLSAATLTVNNNVLQSPASSSTAGYSSSQPVAYSPSSVPVGTGIALSTKCAGPLATLCSDTSYGQQFNSAVYAVTGPGRVSISRTTDGTWGVGAYKILSGGVVMPPPAPTNLAVK